jgi:protein-tyrosine phosphatase
VATSGPSSTYPQRAYRNPLPDLVAFLDSKHGDEWAIWEFRAEGTGYPDSEVAHRIWHYPWPDHHPPPFRLVPMILAGMRDWLGGKGLEGKEGENKDEGGKGTLEERRQKRAVVVHCKAGKGRSGTVACSYLIAEEGWAVEDALQRFTERRMRPGFGKGVSIPSQLRWIGYVDRWAKAGKCYVERRVEVTELHVWGIRDGVKIGIEGYVEEGKVIKTFHVFGKEERKVVRGSIKTQTGLRRGNSVKKSKRSKTLNEVVADTHGSKDSSGSSTKTGQSDEEGTADVIFVPSTRVVLPSNDINIDFERRNKAAAGWTMVTSVAHVWFNAFFEGQGLENQGLNETPGIFEIEWEAIDGIKGSARKGTKCFDKISVIWRALEDKDKQTSVVIEEPKEGEPVPQMAAADWRGEQQNAPDEEKNLGLRVESPSSASVSRGSSIKAPVTKPADEELDEMTGVQSHVDAEQAGGAKKKGPLPLTEDLPTPAGLASPKSATDPVGGVSSKSSSEIARVQSPERDDGASRGPVGGTIEGIKQRSTGDLPGGQPEEEMKTSHEHALGHLKKIKDTSTSS